MSEPLRRFASGVVIAFSLALGPGMPPAWRLEPRPGVAAVLLVGEPTPWLPARFGAGSLDAG